MSDLGLRAASGLGFLALLGIAWLASTARRSIDRRPILAGIGVQVMLAVLLLATPLRDFLFPFFERLVQLIIEWSQVGARFLFGPLLEVGESFALGASEPTEMLVVTLPG